MSGRQRAVHDPFWATAIDRMTPGARGIVRELHGIVQRSPALRPYIWFGSGWRTGSKEHSSGRAIDIIVTENTGRRPTSAEHRAAMLLIEWLITNGRALGIQWILYSTDGKNRTRSFNMDRGSWNNLADRGSISGNHVDHIHVYFKSGASWPSRLNGTVIGGTKAPSKPAPTPPKTGVSKSVEQMATEVIAGKHGNGHTARQRSLGISTIEYAQVRAEVNRRTGTAPTPTKTAPTPTKTTRYRVTTRALPLNGRAGPGTKYKKTMRAHKGAVLNIAEVRDGWARSTGGHWYSMRYLKRV